MIFPLMFGLVGVIVLISLGVWQMQRLEWKNDVISKIYERRNGDPISLNDNYKTSSPETHNYLRVFFEGEIKNNEAHVYAPQKDGLGYRIVSEFDWNELSILVDLGWVEKTKKNETRTTGDARVIGYISYPDDHDDSFT
ncbi:SURF1 family protein, partial [Amylibacter sp.]|nr:SURF1 family protein [Amylibacter sp.]